MADSATNSISTQQSSIPILFHSESVQKPSEKSSIDDLFKEINSESNPPFQSISNQSIINSLACTPDEKILIGGFKSGGLATWSLTENNILLNTWTEELSSINAIICDINNVVYAGNDKGSILKWDLPNNKREVFREKKLGITALAFLSDNRVLSACKSGALEVWDEFNTMIEEVKAHEYEINCMKLYEKKIYTGSTDETIKVWNVDDEIEEYRVLDEKHEASVVVLEICEGVLISGDENGLMIVWNLEDLVITHKITTDSPFQSIVKTPDNRYLFTVNENTEKIWIKIWNLHNLSEEKPFKIKAAHGGSINSLLFLAKTGRLVSSSDEKVTKIWNFSNTLSETTILSKSNIKPIFLSQNVLIYCKEIVKNSKEPQEKISQTLLQISKEPKENSQGSVIKFCSLPSCKKLKNLFSKSKINLLVVDPQNSIIAHDSTENIVYIWRLRLYSEPYCTFIHKSQITCIGFFNKDFIVTGCSDGIVRIWSLVFQKIEHCFPQDQCITQIKCDGCYIYYSNIDGVINIWKKKEEFVLKKTVEYKSKVLTLETSQKGILAAAGDTGVIKIWRWKDSDGKSKINHEELVGHQSVVFKIIIEKNILYSASHDNTIKIWAINLKMLYYSIDLQYKISDLWINDTTESLYFLSEFGVHQIQNPLKSKEILVYPSKYAWVYMHYLQKLFQNKLKTFDVYWKNYLIFPHVINILYVFIKANHPDLLKIAMTSGVKFLQDQFGNSPLSVSLAWKNSKCADVILKSLSKIKLKKEYAILESIENCMNKMINSNLDQLPKFFESIFPVTTSRLVLYAQLNKKAPMILEAKSKKIIEKEFINYEGEKKEQVEFKTSICKFDFVIGSQESIDLLRAISRSTNSDFFRTTLLNSILKYKWNKIYYILLGEALVYGIMLLLVSILTINSFDNVSASFLFVLNTVMLMKECIQVLDSVKKYVKDIWNFIDVSRISCTYIYLIMNWCGSESIPLSQILTILYWARAVTYFRIFDNTRYLIRMIIETFLDIIPFLLIFITATFTFALLFYISTASSSFSTTFIYAYQLNFNDFSGILTDGYSGEYSMIFWCIFFISTVMNPIILLNLLIAIMSDTYDRVQEDQVVADCKEMAGLIIQAESMLFWRRKTRKKNYIQRCDYLRHITSENMEWKGKIRAIKKSINRLQFKVRNNDKKIEKMQNRIMFKIREMKSINEQMTKKIAEIEGTEMSNKSNSSFVI